MIETKWFRRIVALMLLTVALSGTTFGTIICEGCRFARYQLVIDDDPPFPHCPETADSEGMSYSVFEEECYDSATGQYFDRFCYRRLDEWICAF